jgi:hypothetical protein
MTTWMLNRIMNVTEEDDEREKRLSLMKSITEHPLASDYAKERALHFYKYQTEK